MFVLAEVAEVEFEHDYNRRPPGTQETWEPFAAPRLPAPAFGLRSRNFGLGDEDGIGEHWALGEVRERVCHIT